MVSSPRWVVSERTRPNLFSSSAAVVARVNAIPTRTLFGWLARHRAGGWHAPRASAQGRPRGHALALRRVEASEESHLARLPAYSPDLNPDEQVWNHPRRGTGKPVVDCKEAMREATLAIMGAIREETELAKSFFRLEGTRDASI